MWAVTWNDATNGETLSVDMFGKYDDAMRFMAEESRKFVEEMHETDGEFYLDDCTEEIILMLDGKPVRVWDVMPVEMH